MKKLTEKQAERLFNYLLSANTLLNELADKSENGELGIDGEHMEVICNLAETLKEKLDNTQWA